MRQLCNNMKYLYSYNPPEIAFHIWVSNYPFSNHPLDRERFYSFVQTIHKYKKQGNRWKKKQYFIKRIRDYGFQQDESELVAKYEEMIVILDFLELDHSPINKKQHLLRGEFADRLSDYIARAVVNDKLCLVDISKDDYDDDSVNKNTFKKQSN